MIWHTHKPKIETTKLPLTPKHMIFIFKQLIRINNSSLCSASILVYETCVSYSLFIPSISQPLSHMECLLQANNNLTWTTKTITL